MILFVSQYAIYFVLKYSACNCAQLVGMYLLLFTIRSRKDSSPQRPTRRNLPLWAWWAPPLWCRWACRLVGHKPLHTACDSVCLTSSETYPQKAKCLMFCLIHKQHLCPLHISKTHRMPFVYDHVHVSNNNTESKLDWIEM